MTMVEVEPVVTTLVLGIVVVLAAGLAMRYLQQPPIMAYILSGMVFGPAFFGFAHHLTTVRMMGEIGVILLLFFIGMEVSLPKLLANWKVAIVGTSMQIGLCIATVFLLGAHLGWSLEAIVLLGFVVGLSSTAVLLRLMEDSGELCEKRGMDIVSILLVQDIAIIPMLLIIAFMGENSVPTTTLGLQMAGGLVFVSIMAFLLRGSEFRIPLGDRIRSDRELQVFAALLFCFSLAGLAALFRLPMAIGAFIGGMLVAKARDTQWIHETLRPFQVVFVALLFVSIGMLMDLEYLWENMVIVAFLVALILVLKTTINTVIFRALKESRRDALYSGAMLAQIGEFSFVLAAAGLAAGLVTGAEYQLAVITIAMTLLVSPAWIAMFRRALGIPAPERVCEVGEGVGGRV